MPTAMYPFHPYKSILFHPKKGIQMFQIVFLTCSRSADIATFVSIPSTIDIRNQCWLKMRCLLKILISVLLLHPALAVLPGQNQIRFESFSTEDGLPGNNISCIYQDLDGWIWLGTNRGICKFDGYNFHTYILNNPATSEAYSLVNCIYEDSQYRLWIGTEDAGLALYNRSLDNFTYFTSDSSRNCISSNLVFSIAEDSAGILWIGTDNGLNRFDPETNDFQWIQSGESTARNISHNTVEKVFIDSKGTIWVGTGNGLDTYDPLSEKVIHYKLDAGTRLLTSTPNSIQDISEGRDESILIGTYSSGFFIIDKRSGTIKNIIPEQDYQRSYTIRATYQDAQNNIWLGTRGGIYLLDPTYKVIAHYIPQEHDRNSLSHISVNSIFEDRTGDIWVGTRRGMNYVNQIKQTFRYCRQEVNDDRFLNNAEIYSITEARDGKIWLGTENGGINVYDRQSGRFTYFTHEEGNDNSLCSNCIKSIIQDRSGNFWIGSFLGGLDHYDVKSNRFTHYKNEPGTENSLSSNLVWCLLEDRHGNIWIGTNAGIDLFDPVSKTFRSILDSVDLSPVHVIYEDLSGNIYIGTTKDGMYVITPDDELLNYDILARVLFEDSKQRIWIGSGVYKGLKQFEPLKGIVNAYTMEDGLPSDQILGILEGENGSDIWLSTGSGLSRFNTDSLTFKNYTREDGIQGNTFYYGAYCKSRSGELFFGGQKGLTSFHPDELVSNYNIPPVIITDFKIFNKEVPVGEDFQGKRILEKSISESEQIEVDYTHSVLTFDFVALNYENSSQNQYTYIMEGFEEEWNPVTYNRSATYTNLDPGRYTFRVMASNNDGIWNEEGASLGIIVKPPFWKTAVFKVFMILIFIMLIYFIVTFFIKRENLKNQLVMERIKSKELHKIDMMKFQFFTNISHEIRTPISLILSPLSRIINSDPSKEQIKKDLDVVYKNATRLGRLVDQLLDFRKIEAGKLKLNLSKGNIIPFLEKVIYLFKELSDEKKIKLEFIPVIDQVQMYFDADKIEKVLFNLLSNSFKATKGGGTVRVAVSLTIQMDAEVGENRRIEPGEFLQIVVKDTGKGIPDSKRERIFERFYQGKPAEEQVNTGSGIGLSLSRELVRVHNGSISLKSQEGVGTEVIVLIPLIKDDPEKEVTKELQSTEELSVKDKVEQTGEVPKMEMEEGKPILLIIEDNRELLDFLISIFEEEYHVITAEDGEAGLAMANETIPDIILSDILMPRMDGRKFCRAIKQDIKTSHIPIILLTALSSKDHEKEGILAGADEFITKPFDPSLIKIRVDQLLATRRFLRERYSRENILKPPEKSALSPDDKFIQKLITIVEENISDPSFGIVRISREIGVSRTQLYRKMDALTEMTVKEFIRSIRLKRACQLLLQKEMNISEVAYSVGFQQVAYFRKCFKEVYKFTPSEFIKKNQPSPV